MNRSPRKSTLHIGTLILFGFNGLLAIAAQAADDSSPSLMVTIAIPQISCGTKGGDVRTLNDNPISIMDDSESHFHVMIENISSKPVYLWTENNSEGCGTLSLEITKSDGTKVLLKHDVPNWLSNNVTTEKLEPGESQVREIYYATEAAYLSMHRKKDFWHLWSRFPFSPDGGGDGTVTIQAFFEQPNKWTKGFQGRTIWTGKVASEPYRVVLNSR